MPLVPQIFHMACETEQAADNEADDWLGAETASQTPSAIPGHGEEDAAHGSSRLAAIVWRCALCDGPDLQRLASGDWVCSGCGSRDYYRVSEQTWRHTGHGTWMYFPQGQEPLPPWTRASENAQPMASPGQPSTAPPSPEQALGAASASRRRRRRRHGNRPDPDGGWSEQAESETLTHDSTVTVSSRFRGHLPDHRPPGLDPPEPARPAVPEVPPGDLEGADHGLPAGQHGLLDHSLATDKKKRSTGSTAPSWNSRMGPERGVKWRGGAPPAPPKWSYEKEDLRAFAKYERKVRLWEIQVEPYMSKREASLQLYNALSGEPEQELEHAPLEKINSSQGINYILEQLRGPMSQRLVYQKRRFLSDFENINRFPSEHLRAYVNRYRRTERNLQAVDINVNAMYGGDARGSRLLDRARLSPQDQRLVLVGARYSLEFEDISESLVMQFPDFKPAPPVMGRDGQLITRPKGAGKSNDRASPQQGVAGHQGGKGGGKFGPRKVFVAEAAEHAENTIQDDEAASVEQAEEQRDEDEQTHDDQADDGDDGADGGDLDDLIQVLTVTARRLASVKLGRKYSGNKTSPAELKKTTTCAACGEVGHWRGDDVCKVSGKGASTATSSSQPSASSRKTHFKETPAPKSKPHQTFTVMHSDLGSYELHSGYGTAFEDPNAYQINVVFNTQEVPFSKSFVGYMVLDTACQRTCCGRTWAHNHGKLIAESGLHPIKAERRDTFQFGKGDPIVADCRNVFYVGAGVLDAEVPLLASNPFLKALGMVLDLNRMTVHFERLSAHVPVLNLGGHLAVNIACLDSQTAARLSKLEHVVDWQRPAPELLTEQLDSLPEGDACHTPAMAATVEVHHDVADPLQAGPLPHDVPSSSSSRVGLGNG